MILYIIPQTRYSAQDRPVFADIAHELHVLYARMGEEM